MIFIKSRVHVSDSSGARIARIIKVLKSKFYHGKLGQDIILTVKTALFNRKAKKHNVMKGTIIRLHKNTYRYMGNRISFSDNAVIVYNIRNEIVAKRLYGPVALELRIANSIRILSLAACTV